MAKVIDFPAQPGTGANVRPASVTVQALYVDRKRMTKSFFLQVPVCRLSEESFPHDELILGWVNHKGPWMLWLDESGRLCRSNIDGWRTFYDEKDQEGIPCEDRLRQIYLA